VQRVPTVPHLIAKEAAVGLTLIAFVLVLSIFWNAPLLEQANPGMSPNPAKAPWYLAGLQELLLHLHPVFAVCVWPLLGVGALLWIPFRRDAVPPPAIWFGSRRGRTLAAWSAVAGAMTALTVILVDDLVLQSGDIIGADTLVTRGLVPTMLVLVLVVGLYQAAVHKLKFTRAEAHMAGFIFIVAALTACTVIGIWFRGTEMSLAWPWLV
jgi:hypothetical protein